MRRMDVLVYLSSNLGTTPVFRGRKNGCLLGTTKEARMESNVSFEMRWELPAAIFVPPNSVVSTCKTKIPMNLIHFKTESTNEFPFITAEYIPYMY